MSPDDQAAIHTRIDDMEDGLKKQIGHLAESMAVMATSIEKMSDKLADQ